MTDGMKCVNQENVDMEGASMQYAGMDAETVDTSLSALAGRALHVLMFLSESVIMVDDRGEIMGMNAAAERMLGLRSEEAQGRCITDALPCESPPGQHAITSALDECFDRGVAVGLGDGGICLDRAGVKCHLDGSLSPLCDAQGSPAMALLLLRDVTEAMERSEHLHHQAIHDPLTDVYNRREFEERLSRVISSAQEQGTEHALCYLDLDKFKGINDACGHQAGDQLLREISALLQSRMRQRDTFARLGGDEFGVLLEGCPLDQALRITGGLREAVDAYRFVWEGREFSIGVSIGVVPITRGCGSVTEAIEAADTACMVAKSQGKNRVSVYDCSMMLEGIAGEPLWASRIRNALDGNEFCLFSQEIRPLNSKPHYAGIIEILLRMQGEHGELVLPGDFLPAAERYRLMPEIDRWVFTHTLERLSRDIQRHPYLAGLMVVINVSGETVTDLHFPEFLNRQMKRSRIVSSMICVEISEQDAARNPDKTRLFLAEMKRLGCRISIDRFSHDLALLSMLRDVPVDFLKIDGQLTRNSASDDAGLAIVRAITEVGHSMSIRTVASWTESGDAVHALLQAGVDYMQGNFIGRPVPFETLVHAC